MKNEITKSMINNNKFMSFKAKKELVKNLSIEDQENIINEIERLENIIKGYELNIKIINGLKKNIKMTQEELKKANEINDSINHIQQLIDVTASLHNVDSLVCIQPKNNNEVKSINIELKAYEGGLLVFYLEKLGKDLDILQKQFAEL